MSGPGGRDPGWTALSAPGELRALPSQPRMRLAREGRTEDVHHPVPRRPLSDKARVNVGDSFKSTPSRRGVVYVLKYRIFLIQGKASGCHLKTHFYSCLSVYLARAMCRWPAGRGGPGGLRVPSAGPQPQGAGAPTRLLWSSGAWPSPRANSLCPLQFQTQLEKLLLNLFLSISLK